MHHATPLITTIVGGLVLAFILGMLANKLRISTNSLTSFGVLHTINIFCAGEAL